MEQSDCPGFGGALYIIVLSSIFYDYESITIFPKTIDFTIVLLYPYIYKPLEKEKPMHIMQYILTEVERMDEQTIEDVKKEASGYVNDWLNDNTGEYSSGWSDWAIVGGRWEDVPILVYSDENSCEFLEVLDRIDELQLSRFNEYFAEFDFPSVNTLMTKFGSGEEIDYQQMHEVNLFSLSSAMKIMRGHWSSDSSYYDTIDWTPNTRHLRARLKQAIDNNDTTMLYCLVPVDFHY